MHRQPGGGTVYVLLASGPQIPTARGQKARVWYSFQSGTGALAAVILEKTLIDYFLISTGSSETIQPPPPIYRLIHTMEKLFPYTSTRDSKQLVRVPSDVLVAGRIIYSVRCRGTRWSHLGGEGDPELSFFTQVMTAAPA